MYKHLGSFYGLFYSNSHYFVIPSFCLSHSLLLPLLHSMRLSISRSVFLFVSSIHLFFVQRLIFLSLSCHLNSLRNFYIHFSLAFDYQSLSLSHRMPPSPNHPFFTHTQSYHSAVKFLTTSEKREKNEEKHSFPN